MKGGGGANSELIYPIRLHLISGRRGGGGCRICNHLPFLPPPPTTLLYGTALTSISYSVKSIDMILYLQMTVNKHTLHYTTIQLLLGLHVSQLSKKPPPPLWCISQVAWTSLRFVLQQSETISVWVIGVFTGPRKP